MAVSGSPFAVPPPCVGGLYLHIIAGPDSSRTISLPAGRTLIGRAAGPGQVADEWLQAHHFIVDVDDVDGARVQVCAAAGVVAIDDATPLAGWQQVRPGQALTFGATIAQMVDSLSCLIHGGQGLQLGVSSSKNPAVVSAPLTVSLRLAVLGVHRVAFALTLARRAQSRGFVMARRPTEVHAEMVNTSTGQSLQIAQFDLSGHPELLETGWSVVEIGAMWRGTWYRAPSLLPVRFVCAGTA